MTIGTTQQNTLPDPVQQAATSDRLGAFVKRYGYPARTLRSNIGYGLGGLLVFSFVALILGAMTEDDIAHHTIGFGDGIIAIFLLLLLAIMLGCCWVIINALTLMITRQKVYQFQLGLVVLRSGRASSYPWQQIKAIWKSVTDHYLKQRGTFGTTTTYQGRSYGITLQHQDGRKLRLDNDLEDIRELSQLIDEAVFRAQWPAALASFEDGETLSFGNFRLNTQEFMSGKKALRWEQYPRFKVSKGSLTIHKPGKKLAWATSGVSAIPNARIFLTLTERQLRSHLNFIQYGF